MQGDDAKEVKIFPSILIEDRTVNEEILKKIKLKNCKNVKLPIRFFPEKSIKTQNYKFTNENKNFFLNHYYENEEAYQKICKQTFIAFCIDHNRSVFKTSIINLVNLSDRNINSIEEDNETVNQTYFLTSYSLIKNFNDRDIRNYSVFFIPSNKHIDRIIEKLNYIVKIGDKELRCSYFQDLVSNYGLEKLEVNQKFLALRSDFLKMINKENHTHIFKDPITKEIIYPVLDIMLLEYDNLNILMNENEKNCEFSLNINDIESSFQNLKNNPNINFISYLNNEEAFYSKFKDTFSLNEKDLVAIKSNPLVAEKELSLNFGRIELWGETTLANYNFSPNFAGSLILDMNLVPIGLASTQQNNASLFNIFSSCPLNIARNYNVILPFSNAGVIFVFKKFLNLEVDIISFFKKNLFVVDKYNYLTNNNIIIEDVMNNNFNRKFNKYDKKFKKNISPLDVKENLNETEDVKLESNYSADENTCVNEPERSMLKKRPLHRKEKQISLEDKENFRKIFNHKFKTNSFRYEPFHEYFLKIKQERKLLNDCIDEFLLNFNEKKHFMFEKVKKIVKTKEKVKKLKIKKSIRRKKNSYK